MRRMLVEMVSEISSVMHTSWTCSVIRKSGLDRNIFTESFQISKMSDSQQSSNLTIVVHHTQEYQWGDIFLSHKDRCFAFCSFYICCEHPYHWSNHQPYGSLRLCCLPRSHSNPFSILLVSWHHFVIPSCTGFWIIKEVKYEPCA